MLASSTIASAPGIGRASVTGASCPLVVLASLSGAALYRQLLEQSHASPRLMCRAQFATKSLTLPPQGGTYLRRMPSITSTATRQPTAAVMEVRCVGHQFLQNRLTTIDEWDATRMMSQVLCV